MINITKKILFLFFFLVNQKFLFADNIDDKINEVLSPISNQVASLVFYSANVFETSIPLIVVWLIVAAIFSTLYFKFINLRHFRTAFSLVKNNRVLSLIYLLLQPMMTW